MQDLAGKVAVITGAASGIGLALSRRLGADGMRVMMADVEQPALAAAARQLAADGIEVASTVTDVSDPDSVDALARATLARFGAVHVVCNNAGVSRGGPAWDVPLPMWKWIVDVNLFGIVHGIRSFVPQLIAQGEGHVINTASMGGLLAGPWMSPYHATKYAAIGVSESLSHELAAVGSPVGVSVLCPGTVRTRIHQAYRNWPARNGPWQTPQDPAPLTEWRRASSASVESGTDPAEIATAVRDAIIDNRFWVITHPEFGGLVQDKCRRILDGRNPQLP